MDVLHLMFVWMSCAPQLLSVSLASDALLPKPSIVYRSQHTALIEWPDVDTNTDFYVIEYGQDYEHTKILQISKRTNTAIIHGLQPNTLYQVRVRTSNSHPGASLLFRTKPNSLSHFGEPVVSVEPRPHSQLLVSWTLPTGTVPSDVVHFNLIYSPYYSPFFMKTSLLLPGHYRRMELRFLRADTVYKVKIAALLMTRKSPYSRWVIEKTGPAIGVTGPATKVTTPVHSSRWNQYTVAPTGYHTATTIPNTTKQNTHHTFHKTNKQVTTPQSTQQIMTWQSSFQSTHSVHDSPHTTQPTLPQISRTLQKTSQRFKQTTSSSFGDSEQPVKNQQTTKKPLKEKLPSSISKVSQKKTTTKEGNLKNSTTSKDSHPTMSLNPTYQEMIFESTTPRMIKLHAPLVAVASSTTSLPTLSIEPEEKCEEITSGSICSDNGYRTTKVMFKQNQQEMIKHTESIWMNLEGVCKNKVNLKRFLCAAYFPYCSLSIGLPILPCRSMCIITLNGCQFESSGIWPSEMDCQNFPEVGEAMCVSYGLDDKPHLSTTRNILSNMTTPSTAKKERKTNSGRHATMIKTLKPFTRKIIASVPNNNSTARMQETSPSHENVVTKFTTQPATDGIVVGTNTFIAEAPTEGRTTKLSDAMTGGSGAKSTPTSINTNVNNGGMDANISNSSSSSLSTASVHSPPSMMLSSDPIEKNTIPLSQTTSMATSSSSLKETSSQSTMANRASTVNHLTSNLESTRSSLKTHYAPTAIVRNFSATFHHGASSLMTTKVPFPPLRSPLSGRCEKLKVSMCNGVGYKWVQLPNFFNHTHQHDVARSIFHYWPLVEAQCSEFFTHFLCSLYSPICTELLPRDRAAITSNILPCRSLCEKVSQECGLLMRIYEYSWPKGVDCRMLPEDGKETCFYPNSDFAKFAKPTPKPIQSTDVFSGDGCQRLSLGHICANHYSVAALSNMAKSLQAVDTAIKNRIFMFKNRAGRKCLRNLELFLCSLYVPRCSSESSQPLGPCRSQCKTTARRCSFILRDLGQFLPELNNCRQFPISGCTANSHRNNKQKSSVETH